MIGQVFGGGYLGAIIGAFVAIFVMKQTIENEKATRREERWEKFISDTVELVAEFAAQVSRSNSDLLRFHATGEEQWNYEAIHEMNEVTKLENIILMKILSGERHKNDSIQSLLEEILKVAKETEDLHKVNVNTFDELKVKADKISNHLSELMRWAGEVVIRNSMSL